MNTSRSRIRRTAVAASVAAAALVLAACGADDSSPAGQASPSAGSSADAGAQGEGKAKGGEHNAADVTFASGMIPHHRQAVEMSGLAASRAGSQQVKDLAEAIEGAQGPEIKTMSGWLKSWDEKVPEDTSDMDHEDMDGKDMGHGDMDHGDGSGSKMAGMMSDKQMERLQQASGKDFDEQFLTMMVEHHEGAVEMARTEKAKGAYGPAKKLADAIITAQNSEIKQMNKLLGKG